MVAWGRRAGERAMNIDEGLLLILTGLAQTMSWSDVAITPPEPSFYSVCGVGRHQTCRAPCGEPWSSPGLHCNLISSLLTSFATTPSSKFSSRRRERTRLMGRDSTVPLVSSVASFYGAFAVLLTLVSFTSASAGAQWPPNARAFERQDG